MTSSRVAIIALVSLGCLLGGRLAQAGNPSAEEPRAIRAVLDAQVGAWNEGDLDAFMDAYWNDERLTGISEGTTVKGWNDLNDRYKAAYAGEGKEMGKLSFSGVMVDRLGPDAAAVSGKWQLTMTKGIARGCFTQVFRRFPDGWKITHEHSSM